MLPMLHFMRNYNLHKSHLSPTKLYWTIFSEDGETYYEVMERRTTRKSAEAEKKNHNE